MTNLLTALLYLLLSPVLLLNKLTWTRQAESHFQQTRKDYFDDYSPAERCQMARAEAAHKEREESASRFWAGK